MKSPISVLLTAAVILIPASLGSAREWTDLSGKHKTEAEVVKVEDGAVSLKKPDGSIVKVPINRLSLPDQKYLKAWSFLDSLKTDPEPDVPSREELDVPSREELDGNSPAKVIWTADLSGAEVPEDDVSGSLHGKPFTPDRTELGRGILTLRQANRGQSPIALTVHLFLESGESPAGKVFRMPSDRGLQAPVVSVTWKESGNPVEESETFLGQYALLLEFGQVERGQLAGKIYACLPDKSKSVVAGVFSAKLVDGK